MGVRYGSKDAVEYTEEVFETMKHNALHASLALAEEFGPAPAWDESMQERPYMKDFFAEQHGVGALRNVFLLTQAPTGTTSLLAGVNSGIEPFFATHYIRKDRTGEHTVYPETIQQVLELGMPMPDCIVTADQVTVEEHIAMQAAAQKYIDSSVSKTINAPQEHTVEDVEKAYTLAYESGLKGLAYFRDKSGRDQVLNREATLTPEDHLVAENSMQQEIDRKEAVIQELQAQLADIVPHVVRYQRPETLHGKTVKVHTATGTAYVTINLDADEKPVEVFINVGKAGTDIMELGEAIGRVVSLALANGVELGAIATQLTGIGGNGKFNPPLPHAIGMALLEENQELLEAHSIPAWDAHEIYVDTPVEFKVDDFVFTPHTMSSTAKTTGQLCQQCSNFSVVFEEGCSKCQLCGWSAC
jgi:ribonucleoside-diphosphate reductase alpha chain